MEKAPLDEVYPDCYEGRKERVVLRVISGLLKGRRLVAPKGLSIRPTPDKVKGAIFNIIGEKIIGASFLDLFAGTGAIGIEALSRGAKEITFVDNNIKAITTIKENLLRCKMQDARCKMIRGDAIEFVKKTDRQFDIIFFDPPYKTDLGEKALAEISHHNILKENGDVIGEHYYKKPPLSPPLLEGDERGLQLRRTIRYGDTALSFFRHR